MYRFYTYKNTFLYVLESDFIPLVQNVFLVYQGAFSNSNNSFFNANLVYPTAIYVESSSSYLNLEGRRRVVNRIVAAFRWLRAGFEILKGLCALQFTYIKHGFSKVRSFLVVSGFFYIFYGYRFVEFSFIEPVNSYDGLGNFIKEFLKISVVLFFGFRSSLNIFILNSKTLWG